MLEPRIYTLRDSRGEVVITASTRELDPNHENWLLREPPEIFGGSAMRGEDIARSTMGDYPSHRDPEAKSFELRIRIHRATHADILRERVRLGAALADGELGELAMEGGPLPRLTVGVQRTGQVLLARVSPTTYDFSLVLKAPDPRVYGEDRVTYLFPSGTGVGLRYPLYGQRSDPSGARVLSYGAAISTADPVANAGTAPAWPVIVATGDWPSGFDVNVGGRVVAWPQPTAPQSPVVIDMAGSITVGGVDQTHMASRRDWSSIPPGGEIYPILTPGQAGAGWAEVHVRDTYI